MVFRQNAVRRLPLCDDQRTPASSLSFRLKGFRGGRGGVTGDELPHELPFGAIASVQWLTTKPAELTFFFALIRPMLCTKLGTGSHGGKFDLFKIGKDF